MLIISNNHSFHKFMTTNEYLLTNGAAPLKESSLITDFAYIKIK
jgi:hypothetical protein